jgi:hypothetical protein
VFSKRVGHKEEQAASEPLCAARLPKNLTLSQAISYFELAAKLGDPDAAQELGFMFYNAKGCKRDKKKAAMYYRSVCLLAGHQRLKCANRQAAAHGLSTFGMTWVRSFSLLGPAGDFLTTVNTDIQGQIPLRRLCPPDSHLHVFLDRPKLSPWCSMSCAFSIPASNYAPGWHSCSQSASQQDEL